MSGAFKTDELDFLRRLEQEAQDADVTIYESMPAGQARAALNNFRKVLSTEFLEKAKHALELGWEKSSNSNR